MSLILVPDQRTDLYHVPRCGECGTSLNVVVPTGGPAATWTCAKCAGPLGWDYLPTIEAGETGGKA